MSEIERERCGEPTKRGTPCRYFVPCRYHVKGDPGDVDLGELPDASDFDAVNVWLRKMAIKLLHDHAASGLVNPQTYDYYRRAIQALTTEWREAHPEPEAQDAVDRMVDMLEQVGAKHQLVVSV